MSTAPFVGVRTLLEPSVVTSSHPGRFQLRDDVPQLLIVKHNVLEIAAVAPDSGAVSKLTSLTLVAPPVAVVVFRPPGLQIDAIAILSSAVHLSVLLYDEDAESLQTVALSLLVAADAAVPLSTAAPPVLRYDATNDTFAVLQNEQSLVLVEVLHPQKVASLKEAEGKKKAAAAVAEDDSWGDEDDDDGGAPTTGNAPSVEEPPAAPSSNDQKAALVTLGKAVFFALTGKLKRAPHSIRDFVFAANTTQLTLALLCEEEPTWSGRVKLIDYRAGTIQSHALSCYVSWFTVNAATKEAIEIGVQDGIPFNATSLVALPALANVPPSVLCLASHTVAHVSAKRKYVAYANQHGKDESGSDRQAATSWGAMQWAEESQPSHQVEQRLATMFHNASVAALSDGQVMVGTTNGSIVLIRLLSDGRAVTGIHARLLTTMRGISSVTAVSPSLMFFGCNAGDHLIVRLHHHPSAGASITLLHAVEGIGCIADADFADGGALVGAVPPSSSSHGGADRSAAANEDAGEGPYTTKKSTAMIGTPRVSETTVLENRELVVCSGEGKNGTLRFLRQTLRSRVLLRQPLDCIAVFFVNFHDFPSSLLNKRAREEDDENVINPSSGKPAPSGGMVVFSTSTSTIILSLNNGNLSQHRPGDSAWKTERRTVFATEVVIREEPFALQVCDDSMFLYRPNGQLRCQYLFPKVSVNVSVDHLLPESRCHQVALLATGVVALLVRETVHLVLLTADRIVELTDAARCINAIPTAAAQTARRRITAMSYCPDTLWLLCAVVEESSTGEILSTAMEIWVLFDNNQAAKCVVKISNFNTLPARCKSGETLPPPPPTTRQHKEPLPILEEMMLCHLRGENGVLDRFPQLFIYTSTGECVVYKLRNVGTVDLFTMIKRSHEQVDLVPRPAEALDETLTIAQKQQLKRQEALSDQAAHTQHMKRWLKRLHYFDNVGGHNGAYVCGRSPRFYFSSGNNFVVSHPHAVPEAATTRGFSTFHNPGVLENGYISCCEGFVFFAMMPTTHSLYQPLLSHKVMLEHTPHRVVYVAAWQSCVVVTSRVTPFRPRKASFDVELKVVYHEDGSSQVVPAPSGAALHQPISVSDGVPIPVTEQYRVELWEEGTDCSWSRVGGALELEENEVVLSTALCSIASPATDEPSAAAATGGATSDPVPIVVIGTGFPLGEDVPCRGRLLLCTVKRDLAGSRLTILHTDIAKGPVTAVAPLRDDLIVAAVGATAKIFRYDWATEKLHVVSFLYAGLYITTIRSLGPFLCFGDLRQSSMFVQVNDEDRTMEIIAHHPEPFSVAAQDLVYRGKQLGIVATDADRGLVMLGVTPKGEGAASLSLSSSSSSSQALHRAAKLSVESECRLSGGSVTRLLRLRSSPSHGWYFLPQSKLIMTTNHGEISTLVTLSEQDHRTISWLLRKMQTEVPCGAGLPLKTFGGLEQQDPVCSIASRNRAVDVNFIDRFLALSFVERRMIAGGAGVQVDRVLGILNYLNQESCSF